MRRVLVLLFSLTFLILPARADYGSRYVALTFDDGPSGKYTRALLDGLYDRGAKATFLLCGYRIQDYPDIAQRIFEEGHEIGLHGYSHDSMQSMGRRKIAQELMDTEALLPEGCRPVFFRPPGGLSSDWVQQVAQARGLAILHWSVDPHDWEIHSKSAIEKAVLKQVTDGDIILLHDTIPESVATALDIVDALQRQGYSFVTVEELLRLYGVEPRRGVMYRSAGAVVTW